MGYYQRHYLKAGLARELHISSKTLTIWQKKGWLIGAVIGGSTWYTMADVERCKKRAAAARITLESDTAKAAYKPEKKGKKIIYDNDNTEFLKGLYR